MLGELVQAGLLPASVFDPPSEQEVDAELASALAWADKHPQPLDPQEWGFVGSCGERNCEAHR